MHQIKALNTNINQNECCSRCRVKITAEHELLPRIDYKETELLNLKQQIKYFENEIKSLKQELCDKDDKL